MQVLCPVIYELVPPEAIGKLTYIPYPDPGNNVNDLWEAKKDCGLWRTSRCLGINFSKILKDGGYNVDDYYRECTYTITEGALLAAIKDIKKNYPDIILLGNTDIKNKNGFLSKTEKNVYEFLEKDGPKSILIVDPDPENMDASVLPCIPMPEIEVEVPNQAAVDYYTSSGIYVFTKEGFDEISSGLPDLKKTFDELNPDYHIIRWEGVIREDEPERKRPWRDKLESLRNVILKIADEPKCSFLKEKKIRRLIKKYYGDI